MKTIIAGSRSLSRPVYVLNLIKRCPFHNKVTRVVSGEARGVDKIGETFAKLNKIPVDRYPVPGWVWDHLGLGAGHIRNSYMVKDSEALIALWDGKSEGTKGCIKLAVDANLTVWVWNDKNKKEWSNF